MKKRSTKKNPAARTTKKAPPEKAKRKPAAKKASHFEVELDPAETEAFELAHSSDKVRKELEEAATAAMSQAVRKVFKQYRISLTVSQSQKVAVVLFGD
jgi:hypothetical protein